MYSGYSWWKMQVAGNAAYINSGAAATSANAEFPVGYVDQPMQIAVGTVIHALAVTGTGQVSFVRCYPQ
jgi:hypothetical protein